MALNAVDAEGWSYQRYTRRKAWRQCLRAGRGTPRASCDSPGNTRVARIERPEMQIDREQVFEMEIDVVVELALVLAGGRR